MKKSHLNETQHIIDEIVSKLKMKYTHASKHIYGDTVDFYYGSNLESRIEISYNELHDASLNKTLPTKVSKLV